MKYMGNKQRIADEILEVMLPHRKDDQWFVDLFCGSCSIVERVGGRRIANDKNRYLVAMWEGLQRNEERPYIISKELYNEARSCYNNNGDTMSDFLVGWIGWVGSYNGRFYDGGYSGHSVGKRDYISEQIRNTEKQISKIKGVKFFSRDYSEFDFKEPCLIYCDIPYKGTKQYTTSKDFNYDKFWDWCRKNTKEHGHKIFISEYEAPSDFLCVCGVKKLLMQ